MASHVVITGGAGYIGSLLAARLLAAGHRVTVIDALHFGADGVLALVPFPDFRLEIADVADGGDLTPLLDGADCVVHLAAIVGFPACTAAGEERTWATNLEGTRRVHRAATAAGVERLIFASSYSNYGVAPDDRPVDETTPLAPVSTYGESKAAAEGLLLQAAEAGGPAVTCLRLATVFGVTPRTRFDLMVNQFALEAHRRRRLVVYEQDLKRSFVHVVDVCRAMELVAASPVERVAGQVFNVGDEALNASKMELVAMIRELWPDLEVSRQEMSFAGDMRSLAVSFAKIRRRLGFAVTTDLRDGLAELRAAFEDGRLFAPDHTRHLNHPPLVS